MQQLCDAAERFGREEVLHLPGDREVLQEAILATRHDGWTLRDLTEPESDRIIAAYRRGVAARAQAETTTARERRPRDESSERAKMLKRLRADPRAHEQSPRSTLVVPLNAKELAQLKRALGRESNEGERSEQEDAKPCPEPCPETRKS